MTRIAIDPARTVGRLDRKVFGGFVDATQAGQAAAGAATGESVEAAILAASAPNGVTRLDPGVEVRPGDRVTFAVDPARLYFFDPDTGHAITG